MKTILKKLLPFLARTEDDCIDLPVKLLIATVLSRNSEPQPQETLRVIDGSGGAYAFSAGLGETGALVINGRSGNVWNAPAGSGETGDITIAGGTDSWHLRKI